MDAVERVEAAIASVESVCGNSAMIWIRDLRTLLSLARSNGWQECPRCARISELLACSVTGGVHFAVEPEYSSVDVTFRKRDEAGQLSTILCDMHPLDDDGCFIHGAPLPEPPLDRLRGSEDV